MESIDQVDARILDALASDGRASHQRLGEIVGRSPTSVARRQRAMEESGLIRAYRAEFDLAKLGLGVEIFIRIKLNGQTQDLMDAFETAVVACPSVLECNLISGGEDYLLKVVVPSLDDFSTVHRRELASLPGVAGMESNFVLRRVVAAKSAPKLASGIGRLSDR